VGKGNDFFSGKSINKGKKVQPNTSTRKSVRGEGALEGGGVGALQTFGKKGEYLILQRISLEKQKVMREIGGGKNA